MQQFYWNCTLHQAKTLHEIAHYSTLGQPFVSHLEFSVQMGNVHSRLSFHTKILGMHFLYISKCPNFNARKFIWVYTAPGIFKHVVIIRLWNTYAMMLYTRDDVCTHYSLHTPSSISSMGSIIRSCAGPFLELVNLHQPYSLKFKVSYHISTETFGSSNYLLNSIRSCIQHSLPIHSLTKTHGTLQ